MPDDFCIPLAKPDITETDRKAVLDVLSTPYVSSGPKLGEFERATAEYVGSPFAVAVNSGTSALQLGIRALDLPTRSEVVLPSFAFAAILNVVLEEGLEPVFVDIDCRTFNPTPEMIEAAITPRTKAILAVHTFGRPVKIDSFCAIARQHGLFVIEDASEGLGATWAGKRVGSFGDIGIFGFYANKQITTGEGGMLLTPHEHIAQRVRRLHNQGRDAAVDWCDQVEVGFSYRLSEINCALGIEQLCRLESTVGRRRRLAEIYDKHLADLPQVVRPSITAENGRISWFAYVAQVGNDNGPAYRDCVFHHLLKKGVGAGRYFPPLHWQPVFRNGAAEGESPATTHRLPVTERVAVRSLALPFFNEMSDSEVIQVRDALAEALDCCRRNT